MWIIYCAGEAKYWLNGGSTTTVGRKDTDIIILEDTSISRFHLSIIVPATSSPALFSDTMHVDDPRLEAVTDTQALRLLCMPPPLTLQDDSKYGSAVSWRGAGGQEFSRKLRKGDSAASFTLPRDVHAIQLQVGSNNALFELRWEPQFVVLEASDTGADVADRLQRCGYIAANARSGEGMQIIPHHHLPAPLFRLCSAMVTSSLDPTALTMATLCAAKPIIGLHHLDAILSRLSPKIPLPDIAEVHSLPRVLHSSWSNFVPEVGGRLVALFAPKAERQKLFSFQTFVAVQRSVFDEAKSFLTFAAGHCVYDDILERANADTSATREAFFSRHSHRVLLVLPNAASDHFVEAMRAKAMPVVAYASIFGAILRGVRLGVEANAATLQGNDSPAIGQKRRRTLEEVFDDVSCTNDTSVPAREGEWKSRDQLRAQSSALFASHHYLPAGDDDALRAPHQLVARDPLAKAAPANSGDAPAAEAEAEEPRPVIVSCDINKARRPLPMLPCFKDCPPNASLTKAFRKQYVPTHGCTIALESLPRLPDSERQAAPLLAVDGDILPAAPSAGQSIDYNRFDLAGDRQKNKRQTARSLRSGANAPATRSPRAAMSPRTQGTGPPVDSAAAAMLAVAPVEPGLTFKQPRPEEAVNSIFDIDSLY